MRIRQAIAKVTLLDGRYFWIRISRAYFDTIVIYWRKYPNFRYLKIYEIVNYKKGTNHALGMQIGYITLKGEKLDLYGISPTLESLDFKQKFNL